MRKSLRRVLKVSGGLLTVIVCSQAVVPTGDAWGMSSYNQPVRIETAMQDKVFKQKAATIVADALSRANEDLLRVFGEQARVAEVFANSLKDLVDNKQCLGRITVLVEALDAAVKNNGDSRALLAALGIGGGGNEFDADLLKQVNKNLDGGPQYFEQDFGFLVRDFNDYRDFQKYFSQCFEKAFSGLKPIGISGSKDNALKRRYVAFVDQFSQKTTLGGRATLLPGQLEKLNEIKGLEGAYKFYENLRKDPSLSGPVSGGMGQLRSNVNDPLLSFTQGISSLENNPTSAFSCLNDFVSGIKAAQLKPDDAVKLLKAIVWTKIIAEIESCWGTAIYNNSSLEAALGKVDEACGFIQRVAPIANNVKFVSDPRIVLEALRASKGLIKEIYGKARL
jgi:hypothetical protein